MEWNEGHSQARTGNEGGRELGAVRERHRESLARTEALGAESRDKAFCQDAWVDPGADIGRDDLHLRDFFQPGDQRSSHGGSMR